MKPKLGTFLLLVFCFVSWAPVGAEELYINVWENGNTIKFDPINETFKGVFNQSSAYGPFGLICNDAGNLLITEQGNNRVAEVDGFNGDYIRDFITGSADPDMGMSCPTGITYGPNGNLFISSRESARILEYDRSGNKVGIFAQDPLLYWCFSLAFGPNGNLFVITSSNGILEFDGTSGEYIQTIIPNIGCGRGLTFGPDGHLFVSGLCPDLVHEYAFSGTQWEQVRIFSDLWHPHGLLIPPDGDLYVADGDGRVVVFSRADGSKLDEFSSGQGGQLVEMLWSAGPGACRPLAGPVAVPGGPYWTGPGYSITLDGSASYHAEYPAKWLTAWDWDLDGDGTFETAGQTAGKTWNQTGIYSVALRVTDNTGATNTRTVRIAVEGDPVAVISSPIDGASSYYGEQVNFSGNIGSHIASYQWTSDIDGLLSTQREFSTQTLSVGTRPHLITYRITDALGRTGEATINYTVITQAARVDLALEWGDITFWTEDGSTEVTNPDPMDRVLIRAVVHNLSAEGTSTPGTVCFNDTYENLGEVPINGGNNCASFPAIPPGGTGTAPILWTPILEQPGYHLVRAYAPLVTSETYGDNNTATRFLVRGGDPASGRMVIDVLNLNLYQDAWYYGGSQVQLSGRAQYHWATDYTLPLLGGDVTIRIDDQTWSTRTVAGQGYFYQWITLPTAPGSHTLYVEVTDSTITGTATVVFNIQPYPNPDLAVQSVGLENYVEGIADTVHAWVVNQGGLPLPATTFRSRVEVTAPTGEIVWTSEVDTTLTQDLAPYHGVDVAFPGFTPPVSGTYQIKVTVDVLYQVTESNEDNNTTTSPVYVYPFGIDLRASHLSQSCSTVSVYVVNAGGLPSSAGTVTFSDNYGWSEVVGLPALSGKNGATWVSVSYPGTGSSVLITATAAALEPEVDLNPADNTVSGWFNFSPRIDFEVYELGANKRSVYDTNVVYISYPNTLRAQVRNVGCTGGSGTVEFFVDGALVGTTASFDLDGGGYTEVSVPFDFAGYTAGTNYLLRAVATAAADARSDNNARNEGLIVAPQPPDYEIVSSNIGFATYPRPPARNEKFLITAKIYNRGLAPAKDFQVAFYEEGRIPIGVVQTIHLNPGVAPGDFYLAWPKDFNGNEVKWGYGFSGNHAIVVQVAPLAGIQDDPDDTNNTATRAVWINHPPVAQAALTAQTATAREGDTVALSGAGSNDSLDTDPDANVHFIVKYDWDFDDGQKALDAGPSAGHVYAGGGVYNPALTVTDNSGEASTASLEVKVPFRITATAGPGGTITPSGEVYVPPGQPQVFAIDAALGYQVADVFVDGISQGAIESYPFEVVTDDHTIEAVFEPAPAVNLSLSGTAAASTIRSSTYAADMVRDGNLATMWMSKGTSGAQWVQVDLGASTTVSYIRVFWPETYFAKAFQVQTSLDGSVWTSRFSTSSGAGGLSVINFAATGVRYARVYCTSPNNKLYYGVKELEIYAFPPPSQPPTAVAAGPASGTVGQVLTFSGAGSSDPDGSIASYVWNWGDGTPDGTGVTATHQYAAADTYTVTLTVTDNQGATDVSDPLTVVIFPAPTNLALGGTPSASTVRSSTYAAEKAIDGNLATSWMSSTTATPQWVQVDLGSASISRIKIFWTPGYYAKAFQVQTSVDGSSWLTKYATTAGTGTAVDVPFAAETTRHVRVYCTTPKSTKYYGVVELEVYQ